MPLLGYSRWDRVPDVIERASVSCENSGNLVGENFSEETRKTNGRPQQDYRLSRYACYLVAMNGDPRKPEIASAQSYFAIKTREAETIIPAQSDRLQELQLQNENLRLELQLATAKKELESFRYTITQTCPEPVQQKVLGYQEVTKVEYRDRYFDGNQMINDGSTINKTELCKRYKILTRAGKPDYRKLNALLELTGMNDRSEVWELTAVIQENTQFRREFLPTLDRLIMDAPRQLWLGE